MMKSFIVFLLLGSTLLSYTWAGNESTQVSDTLFSDHFEDISNWTIVGPQGLNNWFVQNTNLAGGIAAPEMAFRWDPVFIGDSYILSPVINGVSNHNIDMIFTYSIDWWSNTMYVGVAITSDGGSSYTSIWEFGATTSYPPVTDTINFTGVDNMQIALYYTGDSNDADFWYIDDLCLIDLNPVPVELVSFAASVNNNEVELNWSTATELNNEGFELQRRDDKNDFSFIGFVKGHGTTTERQNYNFTDQILDEGIYYYRLKQTDYDGTFEYSDEIMVTVFNPTGFKLEQNYPNPFNPATNIKFSIPQIGSTDTQDVILRVYDILGNEVATLMNKELSASVYEVNFNSNGLASGFYIYKLTTNGFSETKKMLLLK